MQSAASLFAMPGVQSVIMKCTEHTESRKVFVRQLISLHRWNAKVNTAY